MPGQARLQLALLLALVVALDLGLPTACARTARLPARGASRSTFRPADTSILPTPVADVDADANTGTLDVARAHVNNRTAVVRVSVDTRAVLNTFEPSFASITHDIQNFIGFKIYDWTFDWSSAQLHAMVTALSPMTVRCGGTWEDGILWEAGPQTGLFPTKMAPHNLTATMWAPFAKFMQIPGVDLVVGLNALLRHWGSCAEGTPDPSKPCGHDVPWDGRNAAAFIKHNRAAGYRIWGYELGNEPAVWNWTWHSPIVTPRQHAVDYAALRRVLQREFKSSGDSTVRPKVVGPDTTWGSVGDELPDGGRTPIPGKGGPNYDYWNATLQAAPALDVAAFHYYAIQPYQVRTWKDFVSIAKNRSVCTAVAAHRRDLESSPLGGKVPLWLGEGGTTYVLRTNPWHWLRLFGGALSYLENLSCAARNGAVVFARQQLSNFISRAPPGQAASDKAGAGADGYTALPAWWVAVLWKQLIGTRALAHAGSSSDLVHIYAFDGKKANQTVVVAVNWDENVGGRGQTISLSGCTEGASVYVLTPSHDGKAEAAASPVLGGGMVVNGVHARVDLQGKVPSDTLRPAKVACEEGSVRITLSALTAAFVVLE